MFPAPQNIDTRSLAAAGCRAPAASRRECAGGYQGYRSGGWGHRNVLEPLVACALEESCITPPGSSRHNHRQDQSILNAIICAKVEDDEACSADKKYVTSTKPMLHQHQQLILRLQVVDVG